MSRKIHVRVITQPVRGHASEAWEVVIDHNKTSHRQWLGRHCAWAFRNDHRVTTEPTKREPNLDDTDWANLKQAEADEKEDRLPGHEQSRRQKRSTSS